MKNKDGITLIALIVTIIILLILAGVTISALTGENGLINKITIARKKQLESETEEKLKLKIMELQTDIINKEDRQAVLEDLNNWTNSEIVSVIDSKENNNKLVEINGYIFEIDENLRVLGRVDASKISITEVTYKVNTINGDTMQITVKIKDSIGIAKVITPSGKEVIPQEDKKQIEIDYEVVSGNNYTFKVQIVGSEEIKEYILKADKEAKPEITQTDLYAYPTLTENGVEINKRVEINYGENTDNYYSIDDGTTWNKYEGIINIKKECKIIAKSIIENQISQVAESNITINLAGDALPYVTYDGVPSSYSRIIPNQCKKMLVDSSMWGKNIYITAKENSLPGTGQYSCYISAYLSDGTSTIIYNTQSKNPVYTRKNVTIPINTQYILFVVGKHETIYWEIKEIETK